MTQMLETEVAQITERIGAEIKRLRGRRSGQWLSDRTDELGNRVSRSTISEVETGRRKSLSVENLISLAAALGVPVLDLMNPVEDGLSVRYVEDIKAGAIGNHDPLSVLRMRMDHIAEVCEVIASQHNTGSERDISIRLALQYLRQDLARSDLQLARLERGTK